MRRLFLAYIDRSATLTRFLAEVSFCPGEWRFCAPIVSTLDLLAQEAPAGPVAFT
jgi:hypothetical protein